MRVDALSRNVQVLGIDAGGTMTDTFFVDAEGEFVVGKAQSTPENESIGLLKSSEDGLADWNLALEDGAAATADGGILRHRNAQSRCAAQGSEMRPDRQCGLEDFHRMGRAVQSHLGYALETASI